MYSKYTAGPGGKQCGSFPLTGERFKEYKKKSTETLLAALVDFSVPIATNGRCLD